MNISKLQIRKLRDGEAVEQAIVTLIHSLKFGQDGMLVTIEPHDRSRAFYVTKNEHGVTSIPVRNLSDFFDRMSESQREQVEGLMETEDEEIEDEPCAA